MWTQDATQCDPVAACQASYPSNGVSMGGCCIANMWAAAAFWLAAARSVAWSALRVVARRGGMPGMPPMPMKPCAPARGPDIIGPRGGVAPLSTAPCACAARGAPSLDSAEPRKPGAAKKEMLCEYLQVAPRLQRPLHRSRPGR